jgi:hypothetical protein
VLLLLVAAFAAPLAPKAAKEPLNWNCRSSDAEDSGASVVCVPLVVLSVFAVVAVAAISLLDAAAARVAVVWGPSSRESSTNSSVGSTDMPPAHSFVVEVAERSLRRNCIYRYLFFFLPRLLFFHSQVACFASNESGDTEGTKGENNNKYEFHK